MNETGKGLSERAAPSSGPAPITWKEFLETCAPGERCRIKDFFNSHDSFGIKFVPPLKKTLKLYCNNRDCNRVCLFEHVSGQIELKPSGSSLDREFLLYRCRHCDTKTITSAVTAFQGESAEFPIVWKVGEDPLFGPAVSSELIDLFGPEAELFKKGVRAESQGMGIGAFGYYRRVVNGQKNLLFDKIIEVLKLTEGDTEWISGLESAKGRSDFSGAVNAFKHGIPDSLKLDGHNLLTVLHGALSEGIHDKSDAECLALAKDIRAVMSELADRLNQALKNRKHVAGAVGRLLNRNAKKQAEAKG